MDGKDKMSDDEVIKITCVECKKEKFVPKYLWKDGQTFKCECGNECFDRIKNEFPKGTKIVECESMEFAGKDIITIKEWDDFIYLMGTYPTIYKLKNSYYILSDGVAWVYMNGKK